MTAVWAIHAAGPRSTFIADRAVWLQAPLGDVSDVAADHAAVKELFTGAYPSAGTQSLGVRAAVMVRFAFEASVGDLVVHPEKAAEVVSIGRIETDYAYQSPERHLRRVTWLVRRKRRREFTDDAQKAISSPQAFVAVTGAAADEFRALAVEP